MHSQWRLISELIQLLQLLSVINIVQLRQWNRLFCWILNFALSLGISFVRPDSFLVRPGLVSDLTNDLLMKKKLFAALYYLRYFIIRDASLLKTKKASSRLKKINISLFLLQTKTIWVLACTKTAISPCSSRLGTFRQERHLRLSDRNSILMM